MLPWRPPQRRVRGPARDRTRPPSWGREEATGQGGRSVTTSGKGRSKGRPLRLWGLSPGGGGDAGGRGSRLGQRTACAASAGPGTPTAPRTGSGCRRSVWKGPRHGVQRSFRRDRSRSRLSPPAEPGKSTPPPARPPGPQSPRRSRDSHRLQQRVPHEGLLWDGPDVVVVEAPGKQRGQRGPGTGVTSRGHTGSREQAHRPPPKGRRPKRHPPGDPGSTLPGTFLYPTSPPTRFPDRRGGGD